MNRLMHGPVGKVATLAAPIAAVSGEGTMRCCLP
jgi:hypothetical protein